MESPDTIFITESSIVVEEEIQLTTDSVIANTKGDNAEAITFYYCALCNYKSSNKHYLRGHVVCHKEEKPFKCGMCEYKTKRKGDLQKHIMHHNKERRFKCNLCNYKCSHSRFFRRHMYLHHCENEKACFRCTLCDYICLHTSKLQEHMLSHSEEKPFACNLCSYKTSRTNDLNQHMLIHIKEYSCKLCDYKCSRLKYLKKHMQIHSYKEQNVNRGNNSDDEKLLYSSNKCVRCSVCTYKCSRTYLLKKHMVVHSSERPYECNLCKYRFSQKGKLQSHMLLHRFVNSISKTKAQEIKDIQAKREIYFPSNVGNNIYEILLKRKENAKTIFECVACNLKFNYRSKLLEHLATHDKEKLFKCDVAHCNYRCSRNNDLKRHMEVHNKNRPFECVVCKYRFLEECTLKKHLLHHNKAKIELCPSIPLENTSSVGAVEDTQVEDSIAAEKSNSGSCKIDSQKVKNIFECNSCNRKFKFRSKLLEHLAKHNKDKPFKCIVAQCKYKCSRRGDLKKHMAVHDKDRPFECIVCKYRFSQEYLLRKHFIYHEAKMELHNITQKRLRDFEVNKTDLLNIKTEIQIEQNSIVKEENVDVVESFDDRLDIDSVIADVSNIKTEPPSDVLDFNTKNEVC